MSDDADDVATRAERIISEESAQACGEAVARFWRGCEVDDQELRGELTTEFLGYYMEASWPKDGD